MKILKERDIRTIFRVSVALKGIDGVLETIGGFLLLFLSSAQLTGMANFLAQEELLEDPHGVIANLLHGTFQYFTGPAKLFGALYLVTHGVVKIVLIAGLLRDRLWAYPAAIWVFILFAFYQLYYLLQGYSFALLALTILDVIVILLTWHEWKYLLKHRKPSGRVDNEAEGFE